MSDRDHILYVQTFLNGRPHHRVLGPSTDQAMLKQVGESMHTSDPALTFMVLKLEPVPV